MKRTLIFVGASVGLLFVLWVVGRVTNTFQWFRVSSSANEPTLKLGTHFFASRLKQPKRFDYISFYSDAPGIGKGIFVYRLCGVEGDIVEIKNGDLYVNKKLVDADLDLIYHYVIGSKDYLKISDFISPEDAYQSGDSVNVMISTRVIKTEHINAARKILPANEFDKDIFERFSKSWNQDHFGPITVPPGNYFVLGDNRYKAADSRYQGFIPVDKFVATVLWK
jgi:signal peptidase I